MSNILDYIKWRGDLTFAQTPFCEVDNLIFSMLSFINFSGIVPDSADGVPVKLCDCYEKHKLIFPSGEDFGQIIPTDTNSLFSLAAQSVRFSDTYVTYFKNEIDEKEVKQFAAVTFIMPDNSLYVAYRGTDDTLVGWKEDFNLSFTYPTMSQKTAVEYLTAAASSFRGKIRVGGHSKGGNLSVYSATFAPPQVRNRIITAYSNDGPGFVSDIIESAEFIEMEPKICTYVPQSSVIGMLLEHTEDYKVIESTLENGIYQHNPFSWSVLGANFIHKSSLSTKGRRNNEVIHEWLKDITPEERRVFTETIFSILDSTGAKTLSDLSTNHMAKLTAAIKAFNGLDKANRDNLNKFAKLLAEAIRNK